MTAKQPPLVLVVEDDADTGQLLCLALTMDGITAALAATAKEAFETLSQIQPDAILLDIGLPDMNGKDVCRHLRQNPATCSTPIIAFTAYAMPREVQAALDAGFNAVILKPAESSEVLEVLQRQLPSRFPPSE